MKIKILIEQITRKYTFIATISFQPVCNKQLIQRNYWEEYKVSLNEKVIQVQKKISIWMWYLSIHSKIHS